MKVFVNYSVNSQALFSSHLASDLKNSLFSSKVKHLTCTRFPIMTTLYKHINQLTSFQLVWLQNFVKIAITIPEKRTFLLDQAPGGGGGGRKWAYSCG